MTGGQLTLDDFTEIDSDENRGDGGPTATELAARVEEIDERTEALAEITEQFGEQLTRLIDAAGFDDSSASSGAAGTDDTDETLRMFQ